AAFHSVQSAQSGQSGQLGQSGLPRAVRASYPAGPTSMRHLRPQQHGQEEEGSPEFVELRDQQPPGVEHLRPRVPQPAAPARAAAAAAAAHYLEEQEEEEEGRRVGGAAEQPEPYDNDAVDLYDYYDDEADQAAGY